VGKPFEGRAAIVTGASSGIGRAIALALGRSGMELWLVGRSAEQLQVTASGIRDFGGPEAHCITMDLAEAGALAGLVRRVGEAHPWLFAMINNAGVMYPEPMLDADPRRWHEMFAINVLTPMESCREAVLQMRRHGRPGHLVNLSSVAARDDRYGAYGVSKAAVDHMGLTLRRELEGDDARVTTIVPGGFATNLARGFTAETAAGLQKKFAESGLDPTGPDARKFLGDPEQIARLVEYILQLPIELNIDEVSIRPAISTSV
jgi:NAD(P)-dependent dehydrogenase (short-subunit alcohol dehydrogenase family)